MMSPRSCLVRPCLAGLFLLGAVAPVPAGGLYFSDRGTGSRAIRALNFDGTNFRTLSSTVGDPRGVVLDIAGGRLLFADRGAAGSATSGSLVSLPIPNGGSLGSQVTHLSSLNRPSDLTFDPVSRELYWCEENGGLIRKASLPLNGGSITAQTLFSGLNSPYFLDIGRSIQKIYWGSSGGEIRSGPLAGGTPDPVFLLTGGLNVRGVVYDEPTATLYWSEKDAGTIFQRTLPGGTSRALYTGQNAPHGLALDLTARKIYWVDSGTNTGGLNPRGITRGDLDGSTPAEIIYLGGAANQPWDLTLDFRHATYADWSSRVFRRDASSTITAPAQDPDQDGLSNFLEYAVDGAPLFPGDAGLPTPLLINIAGLDYPAVRYQRRPAPTDLTYLVQSSTTLLSWQTPATTEVSRTLRPAGDFETITLRSNIPVSPGTMLFWRVKVTTP